MSGDSAMTAAHYDVIVVGGGHNGLTCGAYLAQGRQEDAGARAPARDRRRGGHRGIRAGLPHFHVLLRHEPAAPEGDPGAWPARARPRRSCRRPTCSARSARTTTSSSAATFAERPQQSSRAFRAATAPSLPRVRRLAQRGRGHRPQAPARHARRSRAARPARPLATCSPSRGSTGGSATASTASST